MPNVVDPKVKGEEDAALHQTMVRERSFQDIDEAAHSLSGLLESDTDAEADDEREHGIEAMSSPIQVIEEGENEEDSDDYTDRRTPMRSNVGGMDFPLDTWAEQKEGEEKSRTPSPGTSFRKERVPSLVEPLEEIPHAFSPKQRRAMFQKTSVSNLSDDLTESKRVLFKSNRRMSLTVDLETGQDGGGRTHCAQIRSEEMCKPQSSTTRRRYGFKKFFSPNKASENIEEYIRDGNKISSRNKSDDVLYLPGAHNYTVRSKQVEVDDDDDPDSGDESLPSILSERRMKTQFTLQGSTTSAPVGPVKKMARALGFSSGSGIYEESPVYREAGFSLCGFRPNEFVINYLNWAFRSSFLAVFVSAAFAFIFETVLFAALIMWSGHLTPDCVHVNGINYGDSEATFWDAYALSWTTFSTVGYGLVYPATTSTTSDVGRCLGITILTTFESFVGILFGSLWGAILFAKVSRTLSFAQVTFSDPIVVRYGTGVAGYDDDDDDDNSSNAKDLKPGDTPRSKRVELKRLPCPLLEFRVINRLHGQRGGEIIDATMNIVASVDEKHCSQEVLKAVRDTAHRGGKRKKRRRPRRGLPKEVDPTPSISLKSQSKNHDICLKPQSKNHDSSSIKKRRPSSLFGSLRGSSGSFFSSRHRQKAHAIHEDPSGKLVPKRIFVKLQIEGPDHPFFKRVWIARHILDHNSPLLKQSARDAVRANGGFWPQELNNAAGVRASFHFHKILVSLSGTSNVDANSVYAQHIYDYVDLCVGYRFANLLYRSDVDGSLGVDSDLLNDVTEQLGGGGEPLSNQEKELAEIYIL